MRFVAIIPVLASSLAGAAEARIYAGCDAAAQAEAAEAVDNALALALQAAVAVGDTPDYARYFGAFDEARAEVARRTLKGVHRQLAADRLRIDCADGKDETCWTAYAYVEDAFPNVVNLCANFFTLPRLAAARDPGADIGNGTREGVLIHEISHFVYVAGTGDECYSRSACQGLARRDPATAVATADSFQYFAEDVHFTRLDAAAK